MGLRISTKDVCNATDGLLECGQHDAHFTSVTIDSRNCREGALFIPLKGQNADGHQYIEAALENGASGFLFSGEKPHTRKKTDIGIAVEDPLLALQQLAAWHRTRLPARVIGIAGSNGKTTTKDLMAQIFRAQRPTLSTLGNFNNHIGLPLTLLRATPEDKFLILEMGTSGPGELSALCRIAVPDIGVITSIAEEHTETLRDLRGVLDAETEITAELPSGGVAIVNGDDDELLDKVRKQASCRLITFGLKPRNHFQAVNVEISRSETRFQVRMGTTIKRVTLSLIGHHCALAALAAIATASECGLDLDTICDTLKEASGPPRRMTAISSADRQLTVLDDCYNANPASVRNAIKTAHVIRHRDEALTLVLGDMLELGGVARARHREIGAYVANLSPPADFVVAIGEFSTLLTEASKRAKLPARSFATSVAAKEFLGCLLGETGRPHLVLVKASRGMHLEHIVEFLT